MALPLFAITLFVSAFLLFLVQPLIGKMILPRLGGTPQVWNTCMLFFQTTLLLGYFYSHATSKLSLRRQMLIHCGFLIVPLLVLLPYGPFNIQEWRPPPGANPIWDTLALLAYVVGIPFLVVATSAPLLQKWFSHTGHPSAKDPYFLYAASNVGSLLSLVSYPFLVEPMLELQTQAWVWTVAYIILAALVVFCAVTVFQSGGLRLQLADAPRAAPAAAPVPETVPTPAPVVQTTTAVKAGPAPGAARATAITRKKGIKKPPPRPMVPAGHHPPITRVETYLPSEEKVTWWRRLRWILLAFAPSSLMLGVTSYCSVDLSPFPLLWVIPLALYLLSFILVFSKWPVPWVGTPHKIMLFTGAPAICVLLYIMLKGGFDPFKATLLSFFGFFLVTMMCHGELARDRPTTTHLTDYFLLMSVGGALGGVFNGLLAPIIFVGVAEYPIAIIVAALMRPKEKSDGWFDELLVSAFPGMGESVRDSGDRIAASFGVPAPGSHWILNLVIDVFVAFFVFGLTLIVLKNVTVQAMFNILQFVGFSARSAESMLPNVRSLFLFGPSLLVCLLVGFNRGTRFGLCVAALLLANLLITGRESHQIYAGRSYFGVLRVYMDLDAGKELRVDPEIDPKIFEKEGLAAYTYLMHGTTYHGKNYHYPTDLRRLATTYYHRKGPVGVIMERWNWFPGKQNTYDADARLPVSMIGMGASHVGGLNVPLTQLSDVWSEPPFATIGLGTGTMASYGRWLQHVTYYEIDENIRNFSLPPNEDFVLKDLVLRSERLKAGELPLRKGANDPYFTYLGDAIKRGSNLEVVMGDARLSMAREENAATALYSAPQPGKAMPSENIPLYTKHLYDNPMFVKRDNYYKVIVVDAFSSDAIPIHLITKEAIELYFSKLAPDGVLCVHTSNRHMRLIDPVADIATALGKAYIVGHDTNRSRDEPPYLGHFGSEYIMLANTKEALYAVNSPWAWARITEGTRKLSDDAIQTWEINFPPNRRLWTDSYSNIVSILR